MKRDLFAIALILFVIACFGREILLEGRSPYRGDIPVQFYPWKAFVAESLSHGEWPYWNPYTHAGTPMLANMQSAVFYPLDWILYLFPIERFFGLSLLLHLMLAGLGAYALARKCGATAFPALVAGIAYGLNGFTMIHIPAGNHLTYAGAAWAPWMLWAAVGFVQTQTSKIRWGLVAAAIAFLHFLCGHPQMTFYSLFFSSLLVLLYSSWLYVRVERKSWLTVVLRTAAWCGVLVLGIFLAGFQLMPTLEYLAHANREARLDVAMATEFSFAPHRLITLLLPEFYGTRIGRIDGHIDSFVFWSCAYAGIAVPFLAAFALTKRPRTPIVLPLAAIGFAGLFLAWGRGNPFYTLWLQLPGFGHFRAPAKYLPYYLVSVTTLAALGVERLCALAYDAQQEKSVRENKAFWIAAVITAAFVFIVCRPYFAETLNALRGEILSHNIARIHLTSMVYGATLALAALTLYLTARKVPRFPRLAIALVLAGHITMDLFLFGRMYFLDSNLMTAQQIKRATAVPQEIGFIKSRDETKSPFRVETLRDIDIANLMIHWKTPNIAGYDPMSLRSYNRELAKMEGWDADAMRDNILLSQYDHPVLDRLDVQYVLTQQTLKDDSVEKVFASNDFNVYERKSDSIAWAWSAPKQGDTYREPEKWQPMHEIDMQSYKPQRVIWKLNTEEPIWLRVSEWDYPGWVASITNDRGIESRVDVTASNDGYRVIPVPSGEWTVQMHYAPPWKGWILSLVTAAILSILLALDWLIRTDRIYEFVQKLMGRNY